MMRVSKSESSAITNSTCIAPMYTSLTKEKPFICSIPMSMKLKPKLILKPQPYSEYSPGIKHIQISRPQNKLHLHKNKTDIQSPNGCMIQNRREMIAHTYNIHNFYNITSFNKLTHKKTKLFHCKIILPKIILVFIQV